MIPAIDVSNYQPRDLSAIIAEFTPRVVIIRSVSYLELHIDPQIEIDQANSCRANGVNRLGSYGWGYIGSDPIATADSMINHADLIGAEIRGEHEGSALWVDLEDSTCARDPAWIRAYGHHCLSLGVVPGIYTRRGWWENIMGFWNSWGEWEVITEFSYFKLFDAHYDNDPDPFTFVPYGGWTEATITQFTSIPIDQDVIYEEEEMILTPSIKEEYPDGFQAWWDAGGWKHFGSWLTGVGIVPDVPESQKIDFLKNSLNSANSDVNRHLDSELQ